MNVLIRGGGDLGSGVALRLHNVGFNIVVTEVEQPLALRRTVSFANAIYEDQIEIEGIKAKKINSTKEIPQLISEKIIPVLISPDTISFSTFTPNVVVDARLLKKFINYDLKDKPMIIGLGPGFIAGKNCHSVIETNRGHYLGRVIWQGEAQANTATPGTVMKKSAERVLRAPTSGKISSNLSLGSFVKQGDEIGTVAGIPFYAPFDGCLRGLMHNDIYVTEGLKIGDVDPRMDENLISFVSEKSLAIAGGVLEAILSYQLKYS